MNIGVFDSGLGGLIVLRSFMEKLPDYNFVYLGDNARTPYGNRSQEMLYRFAVEAMDYLFNEKDCQLVITACNTISAEALCRLQQEYLIEKHPDKRILGVIRPLAEKAIQLDYNKVGVLATRSTVQSCAYVNELKKLNPAIEVVQQEAPLLVPLVEEGRIDSPETRMITEGYIESLRNEKINALILGCTHYPVLMELIDELSGEGVVVLDAPEIIADSLVDYLKRHDEIDSKLTKKGVREYLVTDFSANYEKVAKTIFNEKITFSKVDLT